jgi:hypothetical protein
MRYVIAIFLVALATLFVLSFASGFGYATGGGTVELFPKTVTASSETGQAVAVWGDIENFNASNTPAPQASPRGPETWLPTVGFLGVVVLILLWVLSQMGFSFPSGGGGEYEPAPASSQARQYGPEGE